MKTALDWLAREALGALEAHLGPAWTANKRAQLSGLDRLEILRWICGALDRDSREAVAARLGCAEADLAACQRVLRKI